MGLGFYHRTDASADVTELEYVMALMQTDVTQFRNTVTTRDLELFLSSRYNVAADVAKNSLSADLDLVELVSMLMIPRLARNNQTKNSDEGDVLIPKIFKVLLQDVDDASVNSQTELPYLQLDRQSLRTLLRQWGEEGIFANDDALIDEMIQQAGGSRDSNDIELNLTTFTRALTHDLKHFPENVEAPTPNATNSPPKRSVPIPFLDLTNDTYGSRGFVVLLWLSFVVSYFTYYSGISGTSSNFFGSCNALEFRSTWLSQKDTILCLVGLSVFRWVYTLIVMSVYGIVYFGLAGLGNQLGLESLWWKVGAVFASMVFTVAPRRMLSDVGGNSPISSILQSISLLFGVLTILANIWFLAMAWFDNRPERGTSSNVGSSADGKNLWRRLLTQQGLLAEQMVRLAAKNKMDKMIASAVQIHDKATAQQQLVGGGSSHVGQALLQYARTTCEDTNNREWVGGFRWTWQRFRNRHLFDQDGVWISARLLSINVTQFFVVFLILIGGLVVTYEVWRTYEPPDTVFEVVLEALFDLGVPRELPTAISNFVGRTSSQFLEAKTAIFDSCVTPEDGWLDCNTFAEASKCVQPDSDFLCTLLQFTGSAGDLANITIQTEMLRGAGFDVTAVYDNAVVQLALSAKNAVDSLYPTSSYMLVIPLLIGTLVAFFTAASIALTVIPSAISTTLKLRAGLIPFRSNPKQKAIRIAPDQVAYLQGSMFWGILFSSALMGTTIGGVVFLLLWQATSVVSQRVTAALIGVIAVVTLHWIMVRSLRSATSAAYYRQRPWSANLILLARECSFFALSVAFTLTRIVKITLTTLLFVGRLDVPFLSPGVGEVEYFGYKLDNLPYVFMMDILQHEAHRHPYAETLGEILLLKVAYPTEFGTKAGSAWRLLFCLVLFPWLAKYRKSVTKSGDQQDAVFSNFGIEEKSQAFVREASNRLMLLSGTLTSFKSNNISIDEDAGQLAIMLDKTKQLQAELEQVRMKRELRRNQQDRQDYYDV